MVVDEWVLVEFFTAFGLSFSKFLLSSIYRSVNAVYVWIESETRYFEC